MANDKIVIGKGKEDKSRNFLPVSNESILIPRETKDSTESKTKRTLTDENIWGNDFLLDKNLDKEFLAEKRRYVRVRYMRHIECKLIARDEMEEPTALSKPFAFTTSDVSIGGIGAVCDMELVEGSVLLFSLPLDGMTYEIMCKIVYCIQVDDKFRLGMKILEKDKSFIRHLKIFVARISLTSEYGGQSESNG